MAEKQADHASDPKVAMPDGPDKQSVLQGDSESTEADDLYAPLRGVREYDPNDRIFTARAIVVGAILGSLVNCGNIYLGLKSGIGLESVLFATIFGFLIIKGLTKTKLPFLRDPFGPHENNIVQAVASGCVTVGFLFMSAVPAMFQLGLMTSPSGEYGRLLCYSLVAGFFGLSYAVGLRKMFLIHLAKPLSLVYPTGSAAAVTIRTLHSDTDGESQKTLMVPLITFLVSLVWAVASSYAPGILYEWNFFWYIVKWGGYGAIYAVNWGWFSIMTSPAYIGLGMLMSPRVIASFLLGTFLAWGVIGPITLSLGYTKGIPISEKYPELVTYNAMIPDDFLSAPSPRYWILWPAVFMMLATTITSLAMEWKNLSAMAKYSFSSLAISIRSLVQRRRGMDNDDQPDGSPATINAIVDDDPIPPEQQVRTWEWLTVCTAIFIISLVSLHYLFGLPASINLLNMIFGILMSFVAIQTYGASNVSPAATVAKASQFMTGGIMRSEGYPINQSMLANLAGAGALGGASQASAALMGDFKTGFLLKTPARIQFHAQALGTLFGVIQSPGLFVLFCTAYPCIIDPQALTCSFTTPAVGAWRAVTIGVLSPEFPVTKSSWIFSIILTLIGIFVTVLSRWLRVSKYKKFAEFLPEMPIVGLAMTIPGSYLPLTMAVGAIIVFTWKRISSKSFARYGYSLAAGGIAGESIAFVVLAVLQIAQVSGPNFHGTTVGMVGV